MTTRDLRVALLFGRAAVDADGRPIGRVHDVRLRRDGPIIPGFGPGLRVEGIIIGRGSIANRLGLDRPDIAGGITSEAEVVEVVMVSEVLAEEPPGASGLLLKLQLAPEGRPEQVKVTGAGSCPLGVSMTA